VGIGMMIIPNNILLIVGVNADGFIESIQHIKAIEKSFHSSSGLTPHLSPYGFLYLCLPGEDDSCAYEFFI
jgi:hypothetical protein